MFQKLLGKLACWTGSHDWTCNASEDIPPTDEQTKAGVYGFYDYARMYCKRCRKESGLNGMPDDFHQ